MKHALKTVTPEGLAFTLETSPSHYAEFGPQITVLDGDFAVASYCVSTLTKLADKKAGFCVTSGRFEKYRAVSAETLAVVLTEVTGFLS